LCNAGKQIQHAAAYVCQNKKENMPRPSRSSPYPKNNMIFMLHDYTRLQMSCALLLFTTVLAFIFLRFALWCRNAAKPCFMWPASCMLWHWRCAFSFVYINRSSPLRVKNRWGEQQNQTYGFIGNFSVVVHSLAMHIVKFVRFV